MTRKAIYLTSLSLLFVSTALFAAVDNSSAQTPWSYEGAIGPMKWGELNKSFALCQSGKEQSPIDIPKKEELVPHAMLINYVKGDADIVNWGNTPIHIGHNVTIISSTHALQLNFFKNQSAKPPFDIGGHVHDSHFPDTHAPSEEGQVVTVNVHKEFMTINNDEYSLLQFHFHTPGENTVDDQSYPAEIHFVHESKDNKIAVVGVWIKEGAANAMLQEIIDHAPADKGVEHHLTKEINPALLLPAKKDHYQFIGSLTTPPCTEGLAWFMMANPITASKEQIDKLRTINGMNARPVQPMNQRTVTYSVEK